MNNAIDRVNAQLTTGQFIPTGDLSVSRPVVLIGDSGEVAIAQVWHGGLSLTVREGQTVATVELPNAAAARLVEQLVDLVASESPGVRELLSAVVAPSLRRSLVAEVAASNELRAEVTALRAGTEASAPSGITAEQRRAKAREQIAAHIEGVLEQWNDRFVLAWRVLRRLGLSHYPGGWPAIRAELAELGIESTETGSAHGTVVKLRRVS